MRILSVEISEELYSDLEKLAEDHCNSVEDLVFDMLTEAVEAWK